MRTIWFWLALIIASALTTATAGCSSPPKFDNGLTGPEAPLYSERLLLLTFERESNFTPLAHHQVEVALTGPGRIVTPPEGRGVTDSSGRLSIAVAPVAVYDQSALKTGDFVVDYPVDLTVTISDTIGSYQWALDCRQSFARYRDPLYRGLNRDPSPVPLNLTLTVP
jgi:hypothetical protein